MNWGRRQVSPLLNSDKQGLDYYKQKTGAQGGGYLTSLMCTEPLLQRKPIIKKRWDARLTQIRETKAIGCSLSALKAEIRTRSPCSARVSRL